MNTIPVWFLRDNLLDLTDSDEKVEPVQQEEKTKAEAKKQEAEPIVPHWNTLAGLGGG